MSEIYFHKAIDMSLLDWFATFAPEPSKELIDVERLKDRNRARHNDNFILRDDVQIQCELRYKWAKAMVNVR